MRFDLSMVGLAVMLAGVPIHAARAEEPQAGARAARVLDLGDARLEVVQSPEVQIEKIATEMGSFRETSTARTLPGKGAQIQCLVPFPSGTRSLILEIQEIHNRRPDAFGYTVLVNGQEVYFRTYQELGAGPNHFFVEVPREMLQSASPLEVTFRHEGGGSFSIGKIWVHEDFFEKVAGPEKVMRPMGIFFPTSSIRLDGESDEKRRKDPKAERERFVKMKELYSSFEDYGPVGVLAFAGGYGHINPAIGREELLEKVDLAAEIGMPGLWLINGTGWGGKPTGPDGLGGYFSDIQYTYTDYEPSTSAWRASWPNMWANTPGAALRHPVMNSFLDIRFQQMLDGLQKKIASSRLDGKRSETLLIREFAPASSEISQTVIDAATRDGVALDPVDSLDADEREWLHRDAVKTWQELSDSTGRGVGRDVVIVDKGQIRLPVEQLFDNLYAHPDFLTDRPMNDPRWGGGQHGMVDGLWSSGEMGEGKNFRDIAMYDYLRARGKLAMINMERTILKEDFSVMKRHFERGFQFLTFFNADPGDEKFVKAVDKISGEPIDPPVHRQPFLLDVLVQRDGGSGAKVVLSENMKTHSGIRLAVDDVSKPGSIVYRLANAGNPFGAGFALDVDGRISPGQGNRIEVLLGDSLETMRPVGTLTEADLPDPNHWTPYMTSHKLLNLGDSMNGKREAFLKFVFHAEHAPDAAFLLGLNVQSQWPKASGHLQKSTLTKGQMRALQLWVQERAIADRLLKKYRKAGGKDDAAFRKATDLFDRGWYRSAKHLLSGAISEPLPATYLVRGHGRLGSHPFELGLQNPDDQCFITLEESGANGWVFSIDPSRSGMPVDLRLVGESPRWRLESRGGGRWAITPASKAGAAAFSLKADKSTRPTPVLPSRIAGRFLRGNNESIEIDTQNLAAMHHASSLKLKLAKGAVITRRPSGEESPAEAAKGAKPQAFDAVDIQMNQNGEVERLDAVYGFARGSIKAFHPPAVVGQPSNGVIEMEDGSRFGLVFERDATVFDTVALQGQLLAYELSHLPQAIKAGDLVDLRFTPSTDSSPSRLLSVKQPRRLLLEADFTGDTDGSWKQQAHSIERADVRPHKPEPNYLYRVNMPLLRPTQPFLPGSVTYHIASDEPLGTTVAEIAARAFDDFSRVTVFTSPDGKKWTRCGQFDNTWQNNISQNLDNLPYQFIDISPSVQGLKNFYLKLEMAMNSADHRFCVAKLRVATEKTSESLP